ncbi:sugar phosphate isomerase/epimerase [Vibrio profundum]|uniref:sugar phosphate isomerase/epimerase family protein n=1 Tax=Vibrio profundum TaxID=2910247 RepID=UPI003D10B524
MQLSTKIGFSTNIFDNPAQMSHLVAELSNTYKVIEIEFEKEFRDKIDASEEYWQSQRAELNELRHKRGLYFSTHAPYIGEETDISNSDEVIRLCAVDYMKHYVNKAAEIGAQFITVHPGYLEFGADGVGEFEFTQLARSLESLSEFGSQCGVKILLENTGPDREKYIVLSDPQHEDLCQKMGVQLTLDLVHFHAFYSHHSAEEYLAHLKRILPNVCNAHFNDVLNGQHAHLPLNKGNFHFDQMLKFMQEEEYRGNFIIEESGGGFDPHSFVEAGKTYIEYLNAHSPLSVSSVD